MATAPQFITAYRSSYTSILNTHVAGGVVPIFTAGANGSRIHLISASQNDTGTPLISIFKGVVLTANNVGSPGLALNKVNPDTITRTNGSFLTDGWLLNQKLAIINETNDLKNLIIQPLNGVAALTLTLSGSPLHASDTSTPTTMKLVLAWLLFAKAMVASAGSADATAAINLMDASKYPSFLQQPDNFLILGPNELLLASFSTIPAALKQLDIVVDGGDY